MRNKEVILRKLDKLESRIKKIGYNIRVKNIDDAFKIVESELEALVDIRSLIDHEE
jgi:hypothetical protein